MLFIAGFDRSTKNHAVASNTLATSGLANCIAIVAVNERLGHASITHFNTLTAITKQRGTWVENMGVFRNLKTWIDARTSPTAYQVGIGGLWFGTAGDSAPTPGCFMRHALIMGIIRTFGHEPKIAAPCIGYKDGILQAMDQAEVQDVPDWATKGDLIPYQQINR